MHASRRLSASRSCTHCDRRANDLFNRVLITLLFVCVCVCVCVFVVVHRRIFALKPEQEERDIIGGGGSVAQLNRLS